MAGTALASGVPMAARSYPQQAPESQASQAYQAPPSDLRSNSVPQSRPSEGWGASTGAAAGAGAGMAAGAISTSGATAHGQVPHSRGAGQDPNDSGRAAIAHGAGSHEGSHGAGQGTGSSPQPSGASSEEDRKNWIR